MVDGCGTGRRRRGASSLWMRGGGRRGRAGRADDFLNLLQQNFVVHGFGNIVGCTLFHGFYGILYFGVAGHDDDRCRYLFLLHPLQQKQAVLVGQPEVGEYQVKRAVFQ